MRRWPERSVGKAASTATVVESSTHGETASTKAKSRLGLVSRRTGRDVVRDIGSLVNTLDRRDATEL